MYIFFILSLFFSQSLFAVKCVDYIANFNASSKLMSSVDDPKHSIELWQIFLNRTLLALPEQAEESLAYDFRLLDDLPRQIDYLYSLNFTSEEVLNIISYAARTAFKHLDPYIVNDPKEDLKAISDKYEEFRNLLFEAKQRKLYTFFGSGKYYNEGIDTSIVYLHLLGKLVMKPFLDIFLKTKYSNNPISKQLKDTLILLGNMIQENLIKKYPLVGHTFDRWRVGSLRGTVIVSGVEEDYLKYHKDYISNSTYLFEHSRDKNKVSLKTNKGTMISFYSTETTEIENWINNLKDLDKNSKQIYKDLLLYTTYEMYPSQNSGYDGKSLRLAPVIADINGTPEIITINYILKYEEKGDNTIKSQYYIRHPSSSFVKKAITSSTLENLFIKLSTGTNYQNNIENKDVFTEDIAGFYWYLANIMPYDRGSASLLDVLLKSIYIKNNFNFPVFPERLDYIAFTHTKKDFVDYYKNLKVKYVSKKDFDKLCTPVTGQDFYRGYR